MANQIKLTKEMIENLISNEINSLDEDFIDRVFAKASGTKSKYSQMLKNIGAYGQGITKGKVGALADPQVKKAMAMAASRVKVFAGQLTGIMTDYTGDMEAFFGENLANAPDEIQFILREVADQVGKAIEETEKLAKALKEEPGEEEAGEKKPGGEKGPGIATRIGTAASDFGTAASDFFKGTGLE